MADFEVTFGGSVLGLCPTSGEAQEWVEENVEIEPWQWMGGAFYGDSRIMEGLVSVLIEEGFTLNTGD